MAFIAKFAASKYVGDKLEDHFGPENPKYDVIITQDGRRNKAQKALPLGLTQHDERVLKAVRKKAWKYEWWIDCHCCCGVHVQFGTVSMWGMIPVIGDFISLLKALSLIRAARKVQGGIPAYLLVYMCLWAAVDFVIKMIPFVGDILTAIIKPNTRNAARVEEYLRNKGETTLQSHGRGIPAQNDATRSLLVSSQPVNPDPMTAGGQSGAAGPSYGTVSPAARSGQPSAKGSRPLLPFWRKHEESDSESEAEPRR